MSSTKYRSRSEGRAKPTKRRAGTTVQIVSNFWSSMNFRSLKELKTIDPPRTETKMKIPKIKTIPVSWKSPISI